MYLPHPTYRCSKALSFIVTLQQHIKASPSCWAPTHECLPQSHKHLLKELFISTSVPFLGHARRYTNSVSGVVVLWASNYVNTDNDMYLYYRSFFRVNFAVKQLLCSV